ncbi:MAG: type IV pilus assembly protein PilM [Fimbriimonadaceae bacterium]|nr:type IV pilus assembly protein PilM [Fimbriimonadaceae bacterium]
MAKKYTSVVGIDIGSQTIKVAEVRLSGRQPTITALGMVPTPPGSVDHIGMHDPEAIGAAVKQACVSGGVTVGDVVISMAGQGSVLVRTLEVANMTEGELKQHMEWEITRNIPFAESTVESDFAAFPPEPAAQNIDVVMAIATQSAVADIAVMTKKIGKKIAAVDVEPLAVARAIETNYEEVVHNKNVCFIEMGAKTTAINIYRGGKLLMPRQVPMGGEMFTKAIADSLGVSFEDAERLKVEKGEIPLTAASAPATGMAFNPFDPTASTQQFAPYNPFADPADATMAAGAPVEPEPPAPAPVVVQDSEATRIYNAMAPVIDEFASEIRRSLDYFRSKGGTVEMILMAGGGSKMKGMEAFLESVTGLNVQVFDPLRGVTLALRKPDPTLTDQYRLKIFANDALTG